MDRYYISHDDDLEGINENLTYLVKLPNHKIRTNEKMLESGLTKERAIIFTHKDSNDLKMCLHEEINIGDVIINPYNDDRIKINFNGKTLNFEVNHYHHEHLDVTLYELITE